MGLPVIFLMAASLPSLLLSFLHGAPFQLEKFSASGNPMTRPPEEDRIKHQWLWWTLGPSSVERLSLGPLPHHQLCCPLPVNEIDHLQQATIYSLFLSLYKEKSQEQGAGWLLSPVFCWSPFLPREGSPWFSFYNLQSHSVIAVVLVFAQTQRIWTLCSRGTPSPSLEASPSRETPSAVLQAYLTPSWEICALIRKSGRQRNWGSPILSSKESWALYYALPSITPF